MKPLKPAPRVPFDRQFYLAEGEAVIGVRFEQPGDHPQVKRRPMAHPQAKAFYLSADGEPAVQRGDWIMNMPGGSVRLFHKAAAEALPVDRAHHTHDVKE